MILNKKPLKLFFYLFFLLLTNIVFSQPIFEPTGAKAWALGGSATAESNAFSVINNMASATEIKVYQLGIYNQTRFAIKELNNINTSFIYPFKLMHLGIAVNHYGYVKYNQQNISIGLSKKIHSNFNLGINLNYTAINIVEQESANAFYGSVSAFYKLQKNWQLGVLISNITQANYNINTYGNVNTFARIGLKYTLNKNVYLIADIDKTLTQEMVLKGGINYALHPLFNVSLGYASNPNYITFGFNAKLKQLEVQFASSIHQTLGITPHIALVFNGK